MKPYKSKKLRDSARGQECTMRVPGACNHNPDTVVLCHVSTKRSAAMSGKNHDNFSFYGCSNCHAWQEANRYKDPMCAQYVLEAMDETNQRMKEQGF